MANSFFDFDTSLKRDLDPKNDEPLLPEDDDDGYENEEEYDALNDETFGACESLDDWEQQHEEFAEFKENSRLEKIENSVSQLGIDDSSEEEDESPPAELLTFPKDSSVWAYTPQKNGDSFNNSVLSSLQKASKSFIESHTQNPTTLSYLNQPPQQKFPNQLGKICTVEELEKNLIKSSQQNVHQKRPPAKDLQMLGPNHAPPNLIQGMPRPLLPMPPQMPPPHHPYHPMMQHPNVRLPPPGMAPMNMHHHQNMRPMGPPLPHPMIPPGFRMMPPHHHHHQQMMPPNVQRPPVYPYPLPLNHPYNFPPPPHQMVHPMAGRPLQSQPHYSPQRTMNNNNNNNQQQRVRQDSGNYRYNNRNSGDEYSGLMTCRDKQWLLNIQMLQLNTGTPYFDDYYYTIYKERKSKLPREPQQIHQEKNGRFQQRQRRNSEKQDGNNLTPRVYTLLQFENSLGKLQCGSVTAPRKIIDMDIMHAEKDQEVPPPKDSKKTKQYLLELEALYSLLLKAEDLKNPLYINNMEKYREMKQKQRLRELEQAPTAEQKQEVLRLFKLESEPIVENQIDYIAKMCNGLLQEDKFPSYLNIRKGKMLLLRLLPHLSVEVFGSQLLEIWSKVLLSLPVVGRRDTAGDNLLPKMYPHLKRFIITCTLADVLELIVPLIEIVKQENNRSTPLGHAGKAPLNFIVLNKLGVSALVCLLMHTEDLLSNEEDIMTETQLKIWTNFLMLWAKCADSVSQTAVPLEPIPSDLFDQHVERFDDLTVDAKSSIEKFFVDINLV